MKAMKKPIRLQFSIAVHDELIETLEGPVPAQTGDVILTGTKGERWPIRRERFDDTYATEDNGICWKKPMVVDAVRMAEPFLVTVGWSNTPLHGKPGDWHITYAENDFGVVDAEVFEQTYDLLD
jgi:hypothetical protein